MVKTLNTISLNDIYESLSEILGVSEESIRFYIVRHKFDLIDKEIHQVDLKKFFRFLQKYNNKVEISPNIESITISHLTTRISEPNKDITPLYNLFDALLLDTDLSCFLKKQGVICTEKNKKIIVNFNGEKIIWEDYFEKEPVSRMVKKRLEGYSVTGVDKCVNGFLFNGEIYKNTNVQHILRYPEILENILRVIKKHDAVYEWMKKASPYIFTFKADIRDVVFDSCDKLNNKQKSYRILKHCLIFLSEKLLNEWNENHNPMLRLKDNLHVDLNQITNIRKIEKY